MTRLDYLREAGASMRLARECALQGRHRAAVLWAEVAREELRRARLLRPF